MGYFFGEPKYELIENGKFARIEYTISFGEPYRLETYQLLGDSLEVIQEIKTSLDKTDLVKGSKLDLDNLKKEREIKYFDNDRDEFKTQVNCCWVNYFGATWLLHLHGFSSTVD